MLSLITVVSFFDSFENQFTDLKFKGRYYDKVRENSINDIVIGDIDNRSANKLGKYYEWPRSFYGKISKVLAKKKAAFVGFDILFDESRDLEEDSIFIDEMSKAGNIITGFNFENADSSIFIYADSTDDKLSNVTKFDIEEPFTAEGFDIMNIGSKKIRSASLTNGFLGIDADEDGVIRKVQLLKKYRDKYYPSFALLMSMKYLGIDEKDVEFKEKQYILLKNAKIDSVAKDIKIKLNIKIFIYFIVPFLFQK